MVVSEIVAAMDPTEAILSVRSLVSARQNVRSGVSDLILSVMDWCVVMRGARRAAGLTQAQLAERVGTSRSRLSAYESGSVVPSVELYVRLLAAAGAQCRAVPVLALSASEEKSLRLHRAIAERLVAEPDIVVAKARTNLATMRAADTLGHAARWLDEWERLLGGSLLELVDVLLSRSQGACDLRQSTPFATVLTSAERLAAMRVQPRAS